MRLMFLGKESAGGDSPTLYATDRETYVIQGWNVDDAVLQRFELPAEATCVEIPPRLLRHVPVEGSNRKFSDGPPILCVTDGGNLVVAGARLRDAEALAFMRMPDHESCVEVAKSIIHSLLEEHRLGPDHQ